MTTYNSYAEAKIANPDSEIVTTDLDWSGTERFKGKFQKYKCDEHEYHNLGPGMWVKCDPANHCMTVEKFLAGGHKLVDGDLYINVRGFVTKLSERKINSLISRDTSRRYILRAAALEEKPKRVKVSYVKVKDTGFFDLKDEFQGRAIFFNQSVVSEPDYVTAMDIIELSHHYMQKNLYRRVEKEIDERQEFIERAEELIDISKIAEYSLGKMYDAGCRFAD
ncbi:coil containing protein [Vibrio phage 1.127.O._10N.286.52.E12]|nr:coil containing protein [Vibrio phage 1.127.O._10N.286.52.E12]